MMSVQARALAGLPIDHLRNEPATDMKTERFKIGSIATSVTGRQWQRIKETLNQWEPCVNADSGGWLNDDLVRIMVADHGLTVTPPPQVPVVVERQVYDGEFNTAIDVPQEWAGKETLTVLKESIVEDDNYASYDPPGRKSDGQIITIQTPAIKPNKVYRVIVIPEPQP